MMFAREIRSCSFPKCEPPKVSGVEHLVGQVPHHFLQHEVAGQLPALKATMIAKRDRPPCASLLERTVKTKSQGIRTRGRGNRYLAKKMLPAEIGFIAGLSSGSAATQRRKIFPLPSPSPRKLPSLARRNFSTARHRATRSRAAPTQSPCE